MIKKLKRKKNFIKIKNYLKGQLKSKKLKNLYWGKHINRKKIKDLNMGIQN